MKQRLWHWMPRLRLQQMPASSLSLSIACLGTRNIEGIALRFGFFYGPGTWFNPDGDVAQQVGQQQFPIVGNGEGVWSWLHIEDAAIATALGPGAGLQGRRGLLAESFRDVRHRHHGQRRVSEATGLHAG